MCLIARAGEVKTGWMARAPSSTLEADIAAALGWWREAGVDAAFLDEPQAWLADLEAEPKPAQPIRNPVAAPPAASEPSVGGPAEQWPRNLTDFRRWWLYEPSLDEGGLAPRVAPTGEAGARLMILVPIPEETDREQLLSGPQGRLLDRFLRAAGLTRDQIYLASALPRHQTLPFWVELERQGMGNILAHHVALVAPARLLVLGRNILSLCGHDPAQGGAASTFFNHEDGKIPALYEAGPERLLTNAQSRARLWKRWLDWTDGWQPRLDDTGG